MPMEKYPFSESLEQIRMWATALSVFRYHERNHDEGQRFKAYIPFTTKEEMLAALRKLGVDPKYLGPNVARPIPNKSYAADDFDKFPSLIVGVAEDYEQPGHQLISGERVFIWVNPTEISISVERPSASEAFLAAEKIESFISKLGLKFVDRSGVTPSTYPEFFNGNLDALVRRFGL